MQLTARKRPATMGQPTGRARTCPRQMRRGTKCRVGDDSVMDTLAPMAALTNHQSWITMAVGNKHYPGQDGPRALNQSLRNHKQRRATRSVQAAPGGYPTPPPSDQGPRHPTAGKIEGTSSRSPRERPFCGSHKTEPLSQKSALNPDLLQSVRLVRSLAWRRSDSCGTNPAGFDCCCLKRGRKAGAADRRSLRGREGRP